MKNRKMIYLVLTIIILIGILGLTYAFFSYQATSDQNSQLVLGDIYMHYKETNQLVLKDAMPLEFVS